MAIDSNLTVSQRVEFSCFYILEEENEPKLNAHRYVFEATVECPLLYKQTNRVLPFAKFRSLCQEVVPDNSYLCSRNLLESDNRFLNLFLAIQNLEIPIRTFPDKISTEKILESVSVELHDRLKSIHPEFILKQTKLRENSNSYASWGPSK